MKKNRLTFTMLIGVLLSVNFVIPHFADSRVLPEPKKFRSKSKSNEKLKKEMLKSKEFRQIQKDIISKGRKGAASANRTKVNVKLATAAELSLTMKDERGRDVPKLVKVGVISVSGGNPETTPVGIIMMALGGTTSSKTKYSALKLMAKTGEDGKLNYELRDAKDELIDKKQQSKLLLLEKSHLKVKPNGGTAIAKSKSGYESLLLFGSKGSSSYALVCSWETLSGIKSVFPHGTR